MKALIPEKLKPFIRFCLVGLLNTAITFVAFVALHRLLAVDLYAANIISYILGLINSFVWNKLWTFKSKSFDLGEIARFLAVFAVSYLVQLFFFRTLLAAGLMAELAQIVAMAVYTLLGYFGNKKFTFTVLKGKPMKLRQWIPAGVVCILALAAGILLAVTHASTAQISWDEGFHGGAALSLRQAVLYVLHINHQWPFYLLGEFTVGVTLYPPLWAAFAGLLALLFGASTEVLRFATTIFYSVSIVASFFFLRAVHPEGRERGLRAAAVAAAVFATVPLVMIYGNLMMLEVPLMLGIGASVMVFYGFVSGAIPRRTSTLIWASLVFFLGSLTKLAAFEVTWGIIIGFMLLSSLCFYREKYYRRFLRPEYLLFFVASFISVAAYVLFVGHVSHDSMIDFFIGQSKTQSAGTGDMHILALLWNRKTFYLGDFLRMPLVSAIWALSLIGYLAVRRNPLGLLLVVWTLGVYAAFTAVMPQCAQYIMPLFIPLALATGLAVEDLAWRISKKPGKILVLCGAALFICCAQILSMPLSVCYGWRTEVSGIQTAARTLANKAKDGDRVLVWNDSAAFSTRMATLGRDISVCNAVKQRDPETLGDSYEWAIVADKTAESNSAIDREVLASEHWAPVGSFGPDGKTILYHNTRTIWPLTVSAAQFGPRNLVKDSLATAGEAYALRQGDSGIGNRYRVLPAGDRKIIVRLRVAQLPPKLADASSVLTVKLSRYQLRSTKNDEKSFTIRDLASPGYHDLQLAASSVRLDERLDVQLQCTEPGVTLYLDSIRFE